MTALHLRKSTNRSPLRLGVLLTALAWFAVSPTARAVNPARDRSYANNTVEGENAFNWLTAGTDNTTNGSGPLELAASGVTYVVDSTGDGDRVPCVSGICDISGDTCNPGGDCTLRAAIRASNIHVGVDAIVFNIPATDPGFSNGTWTINLAQVLPDVSDAVSISGPGPGQLVVQRSSANGTLEFPIFNVSAAGTVTISGLTILNGYSPNNGNGGGINYTSNGALNISNCTLSGNTATLGGGIANNGTGKIFVTNCTLSNNTASSTNSDAYGGGIYNANGYVSVTGSTVSQNSVSLPVGNYGTGLGGGAYNTGTLIVTGCTFDGNYLDSSEGLGGGIYNDGALEVTNTSIYMNSCNSGGAGIYNIGTVIITNSTIAGNSSDANAAGIQNNAIAAHIQVKSCIIAQNGGPNYDVDGGFTSGGFNLIGIIDCCSTGFTTNTDLTGTETAPLDPKFGLFGDNGGPTKTLALLSTSPAIDQGTSNGLTGTLITDQRGVGYKRVINQTVPNAAGGDGADIGAFESGAHIKAVSRKAHGSVANFDVSLPLFGPKVGVECRTGGSSKIFQVLMTFPTAVTVGSISVTPDPKVTAATASVSSTSVSGSHVTVNLIGVSNGQRITLTLSGVSDGQNTNDVRVPMAVLLGDTNNNGSVTSTDVTLTQSKVGQAVNGTNFREDVNHDGAINSNDVNLVKSKVGTKLP